MGLFWLLPVLLEQRNPIWTSSDVLAANVTFGLAAALVVSGVYKEWWSAINKGE